MENRCGKMETVTDFIFLGPKVSVARDCSHEIKKTLAPWKKIYDQPRQHIKKQRHYFVDKDLSSRSYGFSSSHTWMWELDPEKGWATKNWCFWTVVLEKTLESPLDWKSVLNFIGRTNTEAETPILWPPNERTDSLEKTLMMGKIEGGRIRG